MIDLQSTAGDGLLIDALNRRPLLALDFDGTLAPIVAQPADAAIDPRVPPLLAPLQGRLPVAIVSGRGLDDLGPRVPLPGLVLIGNHGNEWAEDGEAGAGDAGPGGRQRRSLGYITTFTMPVRAIWARERGTRSVQDSFWSWSSRRRG